jgi:hypothetical protein
VFTFLRAWRDARPGLLQALKAGAVAKAVASGNTGAAAAKTLSVLNGAELYTAPADSAPYDYNDADLTAKAAAGNAYLAALSAPLAQSCMCLLTGPSSVPATGGGAVPPARELLAMSSSAAALARAKVGLPLLDPDLLTILCNSTRNATAEAPSGIGGCRPLVINWGGSTVKLLPCNLTWEPVLLESVVARCVGSQYFGARVAADTAAASNGTGASAAMKAVSAAANYTVTVTRGTNNP